MLKTSVEDIKAAGIHPQDLNKIHIPKPPNGRQKAALMTADEEGDVVPVAHPVIPDPNSQLLDYTGTGGLRFDDHGMVLAHSILGSLEDFRSYLESKGKTEMLKCIPKSSTHDQSEAPGSPPSEAVENRHRIPSGPRNVPCNAPQHRHTRMTQQRRQQHFLSDLLDRPVENLLMNQANRFRETQEKREVLDQVMPNIHSGYGYRVGSEFWSLPQRYGDATSGISATLTQAETGGREPVPQVGQQRSIRQESASRTWDRSGCLKQQCQELREVLGDMDIKMPEISGLEIIGSSKPFTSKSGSPLEEEEEEPDHGKTRKENLDPLTQCEGVQSDALLIPALRFCGQLARWTGNSTTEKGKVGLRATLIFEAPTGEIAFSHLELHNEGSTAIFYSWEQLPVAPSFAKLRSQTKSLHFYFNSSPGVIRPRDTQRVDFIFKSEGPGIKTELWQLHTHPVLLQGAPMQVRLRGVAQYQDRTADQRLFIETKLEETVKVKMCQSIVDEVLWRVRTPERPSSPAELCVNEEQEFLSKNPKLQYLRQPVEDLKRLWQDWQPERPWDFSVHTLRQVVLSPHEQESAQEESLAQLNSLLLQLCELSPLNHPQITAAAIGQQLWTKLLDTMGAEATRLRNLLGLPVKDRWMEPFISDAEVAENKDEKSEKKGEAAAKVEISGTMPRIKRESQSTFTEKSVEDSKKKGDRKEEVGRGSREKQGKGAASLTDILPDSQHPPDVVLKLMDIYTRHLHRKVYALMGDLVENLCDLMDDLTEGDGQDTHD
ncbi:MYCBP-associated protein isoform X2 [Pungitius pungitius]|uniref:MYCBP-associated protein isoform X2 n=1 Tax=Pungitius pungitius TaxID=134920 RepID=UPI002E13EA42